jgi:hypothetical protein
MKVVLSTIFQKLQSFFSFQWEPREEPRGHRLLLVQFRPGISFEAAPEEVSGRIELYWYLGYQVKTETAREEIPDGRICKVSYWNAGRLESQEYWRIRVEYVEKKSISIEKIPQIYFSTLLYDCNNIDCS